MFRRWAINLAIIAAVLLAIVFFTLRKKGHLTPSPTVQTQSSATVAPGPAVESVVFPQFLVDNPQLRNDLLETPAVKTCVEPSLAKQPQLPEPPADKTSSATLKAYRDSLAGWQNTWTTWWNGFQIELKTCYNQNLERTYGVTSGEYDKYKWI